MFIYKMPLIRNWLQVQKNILSFVEAINIYYWQMTKASVGSLSMLQNS